ncbi:MAG: hypothetical protein IPK87_00200 [Planctomycetes bacterium]|nr:hypothetical protein [Planctomycetota bacterium]
MAYFEIVAYSIAFGLNVLFSWLGARWIERKGYPELKWLMFVLGTLTGFVLQLMVVSFMPGKRRSVPRRSLRRAMPAPQMPVARENAVTH